MSNFTPHMTKHSASRPSRRTSGVAVALVFLALTLAVRADVALGPIFSDFGLTLKPGHKMEAVGPLFYSQEYEDTTQWAIPPLMSYTRDEGVPSVEFDILYPLLTYDRFGVEYRFQIFQVFNFAGGKVLEETNKHRFSLFPFYLQQRSPDGTQNYTSVLPFYGHMFNRFFRDEVSYVMFPIYAESRKRDLITKNYLFPIVHTRTGDGLTGWQVWPLAGHEQRVPTIRTNMWGDDEGVPGHDKKFFLWPIFLNQISGLGSTNEEHTQAILPLYSYTRSPLRDSTSVPWLLGVTITDDRVKNYHEVGAPWPIVVFRRGEHSHTSRVWPLFSRATNQITESTWYLWPIYKYNRVHFDPLDRDRMRILLYLYSDTIERNTETGDARRRRDFWPLYSHRRDWDGKERLQVLALIEPVLANNKSIERNWSPLWTLWLDEKNGQTGDRSQSLLWNLYRRETSRQGSKTAALFGLVQHSSDADGSHWRLFWWPQKKAVPAAP